MSDEENKFYYRGKFFDDYEDFIKFTFDKYKSEDEKKK